MASVVPTARSSAKPIVGQAREAVAAEALHATALVVDGDQQPGTHVADRVDQRHDLRTALEVAREQDDPGGGHRLEQGGLGGGQFGSVKTDDGGLHAGKKRFVMAGAP